jgi:t-SNARE complex subunit (syntaxin)
VWFISRRSSAAALEVLERTQKSYQEEIDVLSRTHEEELRRQKEAISTYNQVIDSIEEESKAKKENLTFEKRARIKELVDSYHEDPNSLNSALQEEFGFTYVK